MPAGPQPAHILLDGLLELPNLRFQNDTEVFLREAELLVLCDVTDQIFAGLSLIAKRDTIVEFGTTEHSEFQKTDAGHYLAWFREGCWNVNLIGKLATVTALIFDDHISIEAIYLEPPEPDGGGSHPQLVHSKLNECFIALMKIFSAAFDNRNSAATTSNIVPLLNEPNTQVETASAAPAASLPRHGYGLQIMSTGMQLLRLMLERGALRRRADALFAVFKDKAATDQQMSDVVGKGLRSQSDVLLTRGKSFALMSGGGNQTPSEFILGVDFSAKNCLSIFYLLLCWAMYESQRQEFGRGIAVFHVKPSGKSTDLSLLRERLLPSLKRMLPVKTVLRQVSADLNQADHLELVVDATLGKLLADYYAEASRRSIQNDHIRPGLFSLHWLFGMRRKRPLGQTMRIGDDFLPPELHVAAFAFCERNKIVVR